MLPRCVEYCYVRMLASVGDFVIFFRQNLRDEVGATFNWGRLGTALANTSECGGSSTTITLINWWDSSSRVSWQITFALSRNKTPWLRGLFDEQSERSRRAISCPHFPSLSVSRSQMLPSIVKSAPFPRRLTTSIVYILVDAPKNFKRTTLGGRREGLNAIAP